MPPLTPPPDRNPRKPKLKAPPGAIDTHIHLFGPASEWPFHPGSKYVSEDVLPEHAMALQDALGLAASIVISGGGYGTDYRHLAHVLQTFPDRFRGVALLPPQTSSDEIAMLDRLGVRGARFVSPAHGAHLPQLDTSRALVERVVAAGWHIQFYPHRTDLPISRINSCRSASTSCSTISRIFRPKVASISRPSAVCSTCSTAAASG